MILMNTNNFAHHALHKWTSNPVSSYEETKLDTLIILQEHNMLGDKITAHNYGIKREREREVLPFTNEKQMKCVSTLSEACQI